MYKLSNLLIWQYRGKKKAVATIDSLAEEAAKVFENALDVVRLLDIEKSEGYGLDLIGRHVGISRSMPEFVNRPYFGWYGVEGAEGFGTGEWYQLGGQIRDPILLDDEDFRFMIKARIRKNFQIADIGDIVDSVKFLFGETANAVDGYDMSISAIILPVSQLNALRRYAVLHMDILSRPIGVKYNFLQVDTDKPFGWAGDPNAKGFGEGVFSRFLIP